MASFWILGKKEFESMLKHLLLLLIVVLSLSLSNVSQASVRIENGIYIVDDVIGVASVANKRRMMLDKMPNVQFIRKHLELCWITFSPYSRKIQL